MKTIIAGIYKIDCVQNGRFYIGSSIDVQQRWKKHQSDLRGNKHCNRHLQSAWNKYGADSFRYTLLQEVDPATSSILHIEHEIIKHLNATDRLIGFNVLDDTFHATGKQIVDTSRRYIVTSPSGQVILVKNLSEFARKHNLPIDGLWHSSNGSSLPRSGWRVRPESLSEFEWQSLRKRGDKSGPKNLWNIIATHPSGQSEIIDNLLCFCKKYDLNKACVWMVAHGQAGRTQHKGFKFKAERISH